MQHAKPQRSLRRILTGWLVWPLAVLIFVSALPHYYLATSAANRAYDNALLDPVLAIADYISREGSSVTVNLPPVAFDALRVDSRDRMLVQVRGPRNEVIAGNMRLPSPPEQMPSGGHLFYDARVDNERLRVAALHVPHPLGDIIVQASETYVKRDLIVLEILLAFMLSEVLVAAAAIGLVWYGIGRGLAPLEHLRDDIASRSLRDLRPVVAENKPAEVLPIVAAINQLLGRLEASIAGQQRFIANAAHQLRTPLAGLKTHGELALRQPSTVELHSLLEMIADETERTSHLVNQLLTLARAEPESIGQAYHTPVNLREIAGRAVQDWVPRAVAKNIDMGFELQDAWTYGEPLLMRELLANLLDNAIAYTQPGGSITLRTERRSGCAVMEVEDNGLGILPEERERVFERFYRAKGTPGNGCGLGLAIVSEITNRHGGRVKIETPPAGKGSLLRIELPELPEPADASALRSEAA
jgi:two-component system sensor histidine kinase TctE